MTAGITSHQPQSTRADITSEYPLKHEEMQMERISMAGQREAFMQLIAKEMVSSLLGTGDAEDAEDEIIIKELREKLKKKQDIRSKGKRRSSNSKRTKGRKEGKKLEEVRAPATALNLEEMFYAQMTGEEATSVAGSTDSQRNDIRVYEQKLDDSDGDNDSFAGGCLDDLVVSPHRSRSSREGHSSISIGSKAGSTCDSLTEDRSCTSTSSGELDVDEIREFVMNSIPQAVRDQIPASAWGQIFAPERTEGSESKSKSGSKSRNNTMKSDTPLTAFDTRMTNNDDDDVLSEISAVTGFNTAFPDGKRVERKLATMVAVDDDLDVGRELSDMEIKIAALDTSEETSVFSEGPLDPNTCVSDRNSLSTFKTSAPSAQKHAKKVAFSFVSLRYYERILSDNPSVQCGPAIGIGWRYKRAGRFDVDHFEQGRGLPRRSEELALSREAREKILSDCGYNQKEIADMIRVILKVKNQRKTTVNNLPSQGMEEAVENARKKVGRLLSFGMSKEILR